MFHVEGKANFDISPIRALHNYLLTTYYINNKASWRFERMFINFNYTVQYLIIENCTTVYN